MNYKALAIIMIGAIAMGTAVFKTQTDVNSLPIEVIQRFAAWKQAHTKNYSSPAELAYRLSVFYNNYKNIKAHNESNATYTMGLNRFADMTVKEFETKMTGYRFSARPKTYHSMASENGNPGSIDWVSKGAVNAVQNQGQCGSCWAFSAIANIEGVNQIKGGTLFKLSEQQLVDCSTSYGNHGCNGGLMDNAFKYAKDKGLTTLTSYPYVGKDQACSYSGTASVNIKGFHDVPQNNCQALEDFVAQQPTSVAIAANAIMFYTSGIFSDPKCGTRLNHGVVAVGYGTENGQAFWKVRNSWGSSWGENGYIRMIKNTQTSSPGECGICMMASSAFVFGP
jgi:C1A family cysteine protease